MAITQELLVKVALEADGTVKGLQVLEDELKDVGKAAKGLDKAVMNSSKGIRTSFMKVKDSFSSFQAGIISANQGLELIARGFRGAAAAVGSVAIPFADFEQDLISVGKTTNLAGGELDKFGEDIQKLSERIPVSTNNLLDIAAAAGQLGVTGTDNLENFAETVARLGVASDIAGEEAAKSLTRILNVTGEGVDQIDELASVIVQLGNNVAASESEITRVATEIAGATAEFGVSIDAVAGLAATLKEQGRQAQLAGSVSGRALREIDRAIRQGGDAFERLEKITGITGDTLRKKFKEDATSVFVAFLEGVGAAESATAALESFGLKGDEISKVLPGLALNVDRLKSNLALASKELASNTALIEESDKAFDTLRSKTRILVNTFSNLATNVGKSLAPTFVSLVESLTELAKSLQEVFDRVSSIDFASVGKSLLVLAASIVAVTKAGAILAGAKLFFTLPTSAAIEALAVAFLKLRTAFLTTAVAGLKFALVTAGITALAISVDILIRNVSRLGDIFKIVFEGIIIAGKGVLLLLNETLLAFEKLNRFVFKPFADDARLAKLNEDIAKTEETSESLRKSIEGNADEISKLGKGLDLGFVGEISKLFQDSKKSVEGLDKAAENLDKTLKGITKTQGESIELTKEQAAAVRDLKNQNDLAQMALDSANARGFAAIEAQTAAALKQVQIARLRAKEEGLLTKELEMQFERQKELIAAAGAQQTADREFELTNVLSKDSIATLSDSISLAFGQGAGAIAGGVAGAASSAVGAIAGPVGAVVGASNAILDAVQQLIDFVPQIINKVANIFTSLTNLPQAIVQAFGNLFSSLSGFIRDFIPNLIDGVANLLTDGLLFFAEQLPEAFEGLVQKIPEVLFKLAERLPELIPRIIVGLNTALPRIFIALTKFLVVEAPKIGLEIALGFAKAVPEIIQGIIDGFGDFFANLFDGEQLAEEFQNVGETIQRASSQLFQVIDANAEARALDVADRIRDAIGQGASRLGQIFQNIINGLVTAWRKIFNWFTEDLPRLLSNAWNGILEFFRGLPELIKGAFKAIIDLFEKLPTIVTEAFKGVLDLGQKIWDGLVVAASKGFEVLKNMGGLIWSGLKDAIEKGLNAYKNIGIQIFAGLKEALDNGLNAYKNVGIKIFSGLQEALENALDFFKRIGSSIAQGFKDAAGSLGIGGGGGGGGGFLGQTAKKLGFNDGGLVPGIGNKDTVPAMLTPGEFVINKGASARLGMDNLRLLNQGQMPSSSTSSNVTVNLVVNNDRGEMDPSFIRQKLIPGIKDELKRASLNGEFLISKRGVQ